jgi:hypothetical protein
MRYERYKRIDNAIKASDSGGIWERWRYGRRLVCDDAMTTSKGNLRDGKMEWLIRHSEASRREIQRRLQCARTYPQESQLRHAVAQFGTWHDLAAANFPPYPATEGERPYNPLETDELARQHQTESQRIAEDEQYDGGGLIPRDAFPDSTPLAEIDRWTDRELELAARFTDKAERRRFYVDGLIKAAGSGWRERNVTLGEAERAFHDSDD